MHTGLNRSLTCLATSFLASLFFVAVVPAGLVIKNGELLHSLCQFLSLETPFCSCSSGVPQGSVLGPLLFILYINDLPLAVGLSSVMLYADDTVIFTAASSIDQLQLNLSLDLNNVSHWLAANGLFLNLKKT